MRFMIITLIVCGLLLSGCSAINQPNPSPADTQRPAVTAGTAYPAPTEFSAANQAYPAPGGGEIESNYATPGPVPTPGPDSGNVVGTILVKDEPTGDLMIYLAEVMVDDEGQERVASYDRSNSPRAYTNAEGLFIFSGIKPGKYGLILDTVLSSFLLYEPDGDQPLLVEVKASEQADVGEINYDELPIPETP